MTTLTVPSLLDASERGATRTRDAALWALIGVCIISAALGRLSYLVKPFDHDARMFIYLGKLVCDGGRFYHDVIDNKFPSVGLMTSVCWRAFGTNWCAYVILQTALAVGGALLLGRSAARHLGDQARLPATLFALIYLNLNVAVFGGFQLETMQSFFAILAAGAAMEALRGEKCIDASVVGLAAGCAMMLKPTGGAALGAFALAACVTWRRDPRRVVMHGFFSACGLALPMFVVLVYVIRTDILRDMPELCRQIARYARETPMQWDDWLKPIVVCVLVGFPLVVRGWVARRDRIGEGTSDCRALVVFAGAWFTLELVGAVMQRRMYSYHFLPVVAPAALLFAMFPRRMRVAPLAAALLPAAMISILGAREVFAACYPPTYRLAASDYLVAHTSAGDRVWQDSMPRLLLETNLKPGARIPLTFLFFNYDAAPLEYCATILHDFDVRRPKYVLLPENLEAKLKYEGERAPEMQRRPVRAENYRIAWRQIEAYVRLHYTPEATIEREIIYRRAD